MLALSAVEQEQRDGRLLRHTQEVLEELEGRFVRSMEVLEGKAERHLVGETAGPLIEELERPVLNALAVELAQPLRCVRLEREPEDAGEKRIGLFGVLGAEQMCQLSFQLQPNARLGCRGTDAKPLAEEVADGPVGEILRVGHATAFDEADTVAIAAPHLEHETRLADPRLPRHRDDGTAALDQSVHRVLEHCQLEFPSDERCLRRGALLLTNAGDAVRRDRGLLSLELALTELLELEAALDLTLGGRPNDDAPVVGELLEAGRDVDGVAEGVVTHLSIVDLGREDDLARVHPDSRRQLDSVSRLDV